MIVFAGAFIVIASVIGGFFMAGGYLKALFHISELVMIGGGSLGALVIMSPKKVLIDLARGMVSCIKGSSINRKAYEDLLKALYELFMLGRRNGMIALEEHVMEPENSSIFKKYPGFAHHKHAVEFLCSGLRPIIDGKIKPDQLRLLLDLEMDKMDDEHHAPVSVLTKAADAMPGFGIVAAVLGIVVTMASIAGPIELIGEKVAAALVGTFLGIFLSYGFMNPLAMNLQFIGAAEQDYIRCIATCVVGFANGMPPVMAVELGRRGMSSDLRPNSTEMEAMLKGVGNPRPSGGG